MDDRRLQRKLEEESRLPAEPERRSGRSALNPMRSGGLTATLLVAALFLFGFLWRAHQHARFHQLTAPVLPQVDDTPLPGGQAAVVLSRTAPAHAAVPEWVQATLLPGIGMQVLQLAVAMPGQQAISLLNAPTVTQVAQNALSKPDAGAFHLMLGGPVQAGSPGVEVIADRHATKVVNEVEADGGDASGTFLAVDDLGKASGVEAKIDATLTGRSFDVEARLHNDSLGGREFLFDWTPHFLAPGKQLSNFRLSVPSTEEWAGGEVRSVRGTPMDFSEPAGAAIPRSGFNAIYLNLRPATIGNGPEIRLTDTQSGLVLRLVLLSPSIRSVRVHADAAAGTLTLSLSTDEGAQHTTLEAGESAEWHVRLDVLSLADKTAGAAF